MANWPYVNISGNHLAPLEDYMNNTCAPPGTTWTPLTQHHLETALTTHVQNLITKWITLKYKFGTGLIQLLPNGTTLKQVQDYFETNGTQH